MGLGMLGLAPLLNELSFGQDPSTPNGALQGGPETQTTGNSLRVRAPHFAPKAKRMVHFFLNGGPSHVDTFDPKPKLLEYAGKPLPTSYLTERRTGGALPSPFSKDSGACRQHRGDPIDGCPSPQPRAIADAHELRRLGAVAPEPRLLVDVWSRD
jgi:hypothetical protein